MRSRHVAITHDTWLRANGKAPENYTVAELAEVLRLIDMASLGDLMLFMASELERADQIIFLYKLWEAAAMGRIPELVVWPRFPYELFVNAAGGLVLNVTAAPAPQVSEDNLSGSSVSSGGRDAAGIDHTQEAAAAQQELQGSQGMSMEVDPLVDELDDIQDAAAAYQVSEDNLSGRSHGDDLRDLEIYPAQEAAAAQEVPLAAAGNGKPCKQRAHSDLDTLADAALMATAAEVLTEIALEAAAALHMG